MTVGILEINASAAVPVIELAVVETPGSAAIGELGVAYPLEDCVEFGIADVKGIVVAFERGLIIEQQGQRVVDPHGSEVAGLAIEMQAEDARERARDDAAKQKAAELYRVTLKVRPAYPAARVGLARVLLDLNQYEAALNEIEAARRTRPVYAEASAVEGRINREAAFTEDAIKSFRRAIREAHGFQPEAHVGLARVFEDKGQYDEAILEFRKAIDQLSDSEPVIYQLLVLHQ